MSAKGKARIAAAQKLRWALQGKVSKPAKAVARKTPTKPGRKAAKKIAEKVSKKAVGIAQKSIAAPGAEA
jgi:hypothetical protein